MEYVCGNIYVREMRFDGEAGKVVSGHSHNFDHTTYVSKGAILVERISDNGEVERAVIKKASDGFNWILIEAGVTHRITSMESDSIAHCVYSHRNPQGDVTQEYHGWTPGYV